MWKRCAGLALFILLLAGQANAYDTNAYWKSESGNRFFKDNVLCTGTLEGQTLIFTAGRLNGNLVIVGHLGATGNMNVTGDVNTTGTNTHIGSASVSVNMGIGGTTLSGTEAGYIDGATPGTPATNKAVVCAASSGLTAAEVAVLDGATAGSVVVNKAVVAGGSGDVAGFRDIVASRTIQGLVVYATDDGLFGDDIICSGALQIEGTWEIDGTQVVHGG